MSESNPLVPRVTREEILADFNGISQGEIEATLCDIMARINDQFNSKLYRVSSVGTGTVYATVHLEYPATPLYWACCQYLHNLQYTEEFVGDYGHLRAWQNAEDSSKIHFGSSIHLKATELNHSSEFEKSEALKWDVRLENFQKQQKQ